MILDVDSGADGKDGCTMARLNDAMLDKRSNDLESCESCIGSGGYILYAGTSIVYNQLY